MPSVFGGMLELLRQTRKHARANAIRQLYGRHKGVTQSTPGYKLAETPTVYKDGREVMEYRLYKLIDAEVVEISHEILTKTESGPEAALEMKKSWQPPKSVSSPSTTKPETK